jgi:DNA-binding MarR family transcriptional regulator
VPGPGRAVRHRLTDRGEKLREQAGATLQEVLTESFSPLSAEEVQTFGELLARILGR